MFEPVRLKSEEFSQLVLGLERAFSRHAAALVVDERLPSAEIEVLDWEETGLEEEAVARYREVVEYLDQLLLFAFADAPTKVVADWADTYDASLRDEAVQRIETMRNNMPSLRDLWDAKVSSVVPILSSLAYEVITSESEDDVSARSVLLSMSASRLGILGRVDKSSTQMLAFRLWPSDLRLLRREIDHVLEVHFGKEGEQ